MDIRRKSVGKSEGFLRRILTDVSQINHESGQTSVHHRRIIRHQKLFFLINLQCLLLVYSLKRGDV